MSQSTPDFSRTTAPSQRLCANRRIPDLSSYHNEYARSIVDSDAYWAQQGERLHWFTPPDHGAAIQHAHRQVRVVHWRENKRELQLRDPPCTIQAGQNRDHLGQG